MSQNEFKATPTPSEHMEDSMYLWVNKGILPGSFGTALLLNSLSGAVMAADARNRIRIPEWVEWCYWNLPSSCWGSEEKVLAWEAAGGMHGMQAAAEAEEANLRG